MKVREEDLCRNTGLLVSSLSSVLNVFFSLSFCVQTQMPTNRKGHSAVVLGSAMLMYGGFIDMKGTLQDFWSLDFSEFKTDKEKNSVSSFHMKLTKS